MLNTIGDLQTETLVRLGLSTTATSNAGLTDTILNNWVREAHNWATAYHKWPATEGRVSSTYTTTEEWLFEGYKADSFRFIQVGGKRLQKLNFEDYQIFRETSPSANDRVYSDFGRTIFINPSVDASGTVTAWGQYAPVIDVTDKAALTVFSGFDEEANDAIVEEMLRYAKERERKLVEAQAHHQKAIELLENVWKRSQDEASVYQTHPNRGGMYKRFDILRGVATEEVMRRDQF